MSEHREAAIRIVAYDKSWPANFQFERESLTTLLAPWLIGDIEHIGSTAVPGLAAKPVIDMMAPVASLELSRPVIDVLSASGYCYFPYKADVMHWFCKPSPQVRTHHLHVVPLGSPLWLERLAFRDALRKSAPLAAQYAVLKQDLAGRFTFDREAYTEAKSGFIHSVLANSQNGMRFHEDTVLHRDQP